MNVNHALSSHTLPAMFPETIGYDPVDCSWRFAVRCPQAEQVMLVTEDATGLSSWVPMTASGDRHGTWELELPESRIAGPVRYYTIEGGSVLNCGTAGLSATRVEDGDVADEPAIAASA